MWGAIIGAIVAIVGMIVAAEENKKQQKANKDLAEFQNDANQKFLREQNEYNTPTNQMKRFQAAGLNPHLIYGQGSPGNQTAPLSYPEIKPTNLQGTISNKINDMVPLANQTRLVNSQVQAQNAQTTQRYAQTEVNKLQAKVLAKNPLLDNDGFKATIDGLKTTAALKAQQTESTKISNFVADSTAHHKVTLVQKEIDNLETKYNIQKLDEKMKAEVLNSQQFRNDILEVQRKFMVDGDITPQHILMFITMLFGKI